MHPSPEEPAVAVLALDPSRRGALRALGAAGMALAGMVGLGHALDASAARNARGNKNRGVHAAKKKKTKQGPPGPPGPQGPPGPPGAGKLSLVPGNEGPITILDGGTNPQAASTCPPGTLGVAFNLQYQIRRPAPPTALDMCWILLNTSTEVGWLTEFKCEGSATVDGSLIAFCLKQT